jgi:hypothetical protein
MPRLFQGMDNFGKIKEGQIDVAGFFELLAR